MVERCPVGPLPRLGGKCDLDQMLERHPNAGGGRAPSMAPASGAPPASGF